MPALRGPELLSSGAPYDPSQAFRYFSKAAPKQHAIGRALLAGLYERGHGVAKNDVEALRLYKLSAEQGCVTAQYNAGVGCEYGRGGPVAAAGPST